MTRLTDSEVYFIQRAIESRHAEFGPFGDGDYFYTDARSVAEKLAFRYDGWLADRLAEIERRNSGAE